MRLLHWVVGLALAISQSSGKYMHDKYIEIPIERKYHDGSVKLKNHTLFVDKSDWHYEIYDLSKHAEFPFIERISFTVK